MPTLYKPYIKLKLIEILKQQSAPKLANLEVEEILQIQPPTKSTLKLIYIIIKP